MDVEDLLCATGAAKYLGLKHRQYFYDVKKKFRLEPAAKVGSMPLYMLSQLKKIKKELDGIK